MNNVTSAKLAEDLFSITLDNGQYLIYSPLRNFVFEANGAAVTIVAKLINGRAPNSDQETSILLFLRENGLLKESKRLVSTPQGPFTKLTLSLTYRCNLRCIYCYAAGGESMLVMPWEIAKAAIDHTVQNVIAVKKDTLAITFHGAGEATVVWSLLSKCVDYAEKLAISSGLKIELSLVTNGALINSSDKADWIKQHFRSLSLSMDGPEDLQNLQRPQASGRGSFDDVMLGISKLRAAGMRFTIRSTITSYSVLRQQELVDFFASSVLETGGKLHFEPITACGRALNRNELAADGSLFTSVYKEAVILAKARGVVLTCSADALEKVSSSFCGANGRIFCVLPTGEVSGCTRVTKATDSGANTFLYGNYDSVDHSFVLDKTRLNALRCLGLPSLPECSDCFCKWHCAGHCPQTRTAYPDHALAMCKVTQDLVRWRLIKSLENQD